MGCGSSSHRKIGLHFNPLSNSNPDPNSEPLYLCRDRTDLIRSAGDRRYGAAAAHASYLRSLDAVSESLGNFARDELSISAPGSPVLTLPPSSKGKSKQTDSDPGSDSDSSTVTPLSHSLSFEDEEEEEENDKLKKSKTRSSNPNSSTVTPLSHAFSVEKEKPSLEPSRSSKQEESTTMSPKNYQTSSSRAIPYGSDPYTYDYGYGYPPYGSETAFPDLNYSNPNYDDRPGPSNAAPPPPPMDDNSTWDFFDPFSNYDQFMMNYSNERFEYPNSNSYHGSPDSNEVRKQEGIPELEEELEFTEKEPKNEKEKEKEKEGSVGPAVSVIVGTNSVISEAGSNGKNKEVKFEDDKEATKSISIVTSSSSSGALMAGTRDLNEVIEEIKHEFQSVIDFSQEVSNMLEVGKVQHQSGLLGVTLASTIPILPSSCLPHKQLRKNKNNAITSTINANGDLHSGSLMPLNLSLTLEKLYVWEKRLYKEVKDEEKLRTEYERKYKKMKHLIDYGEDSDMISLAREALKPVESKLTVAIKSVQTISMQIHRIRDQELQPQLVELVRGLIRFWKSILECHAKQLKAITSLNSLNLKARIKSDSAQIARSSLKLEREMSKWQRRFKKWISAQKSFIEALNFYLILWIQKEPVSQTETPDGVPPFSPSDLGAPATFIVSNDLYQAVRNINDDRILEVISEFGNVVRDYRRLQETEKRHRVRAEYLSKIYQRRFKDLQEKIGFTAKEETLEIVSENREDDLGNEEVYQTRDHFHQVAQVEMMKKRRDEEREKHKDALERLNDAASSVLSTGLVPVFEELVNFVSENLNAYELIRVPGQGQGS